MDSSRTYVNIMKIVLARVCMKGVMNS